MAENTKTAAEAPETVIAASRSEVFRAAKSEAVVCGFTHTFYKYPARFSPEFARAVIEAFTKPGDTVFDPFMGGGTTLVEAAVLGRRAVGVDINPLAVFVAQAKTTPLTESDLATIRAWSGGLRRALNLGKPSVVTNDWGGKGYLRNIRCNMTWRIRKALELGLTQVEKLRTARQQHFARCLLLKTAQWALDCRRTIPSVADFRERLTEDLDEMLNGAEQYRTALSRVRRRDGGRMIGPKCLTRSVVGVEKDGKLGPSFPPALILTSPPYPGMHVLYHRWQVRGRRETPAPFWIVGSKDGSGASYYTLGDRKAPSLGPYFEKLRAAMRSLAAIADRRTILVQMVAFSDTSSQFSRYLEVIEDAGFREIEFASVPDCREGRIWREVPHRRWYVSQKKETMARSEVVLFHRLS